MRIYSDLDVGNAASFFHDEPGDCHINTSTSYSIMMHPDTHFVATGTNTSQGILL
jgi:hypothetical protein